MLVSCGGINELENILKKHNDKPMNIEMLVESAINNSVNTKELNATLYQVAELFSIVLFQVFININSVFTNPKRISHKS